MYVLFWIVLFCKHTYVHILITSLNCGHSW
jgi:hypothetical protein